MQTFRTLIVEKLLEDDFQRANATQLRRLIKGLEVGSIEVAMQFADAGLQGFSMSRALALDNLARRIYSQSQKAKAQLSRVTGGPVL